jgi:hypothetical protein
MKRRPHPHRPGQSAPPPKKPPRDIERRARHHSPGATMTFTTTVARDTPNERSQSPFTPPPDGPREYYLVRYVHEDPEGDEVRGGLYHERLASPAVVAALVAELRRFPQNTKITVYRVMETWERIELR